MSTPKPIGSLGELLPYLGDGDRSGEILDKLRDLVVAVRAAGASGKVTWTITVSPPGGSSQGGGRSETVLITDRVGLTLPQRRYTPAVFFANDDGDLARSSFRQTEMFGAQVPAEDQGQEPAARDEATA